MTRTEKFGYVSWHDIIAFEVARFRGWRACRAIRKARRAARVTA